jgi:hypothetical protein
MAEDGENLQWIAISHAATIVEQMSKLGGDDPLSSQLLRAPSQVKVWAASRKTTPDAVERRHFAKLVMSLQACLPHVSIEPAVSTPPPTVATPVPLRRPCAAVTDAVAPVPIPTTWPGRFKQVLLSWWMAAPSSLCVFLVLAGALILCRPELLVEFPLRVFAWLPWYVEWALNRLLARVERELGLDGWYTSTVAPASGTSAGQGGPAAQQTAAAQPFTLLTLVGLITYFVRK